MNGQFSQFFVTASSARQPLNYSEPFSLLLYCTESRGCLEGLARGSPASKKRKKKKKVRGNQDSESLMPSAAAGVTFSWVHSPPSFMGTPGCLFFFADSLASSWLWWSWGRAGRCRLQLREQHPRRQSWGFKTLLSS